MASAVFAALLMQRVSEISLNFIIVAGGGAGGYLSAAYTGGAGGSGVVIIRTLSLASATTGSPTITTDAGFNVYRFTGSGSITF